MLAANGRVGSYTADDVRDVVERNDKRRFELRDVDEERLHLCGREAAGPQRAYAEALRPKVQEHKAGEPQLHQREVLCQLLELKAFILELL